MATPKPISIQRALAAVAALGKPPTEKQLAEVAPHMGNWLSISAVLTSLPLKDSSLATLRAMLAYEVAREGGPRDMVVYRIANRHERLSTQLRIQAVAKALPAIAHGLRTPA